MTKLAINGGPKIRNKYFPRQNNIGEEEKEAVNNVLDSNILSGYRGNWSESFYGGREVKALEREFAHKFNAHYAIACNSCTSALFIACGALDLDTFHNVIVTPWSMSCSATMPLAYAALPVFADLEKYFFCLEAESIEEQINNATKAIITVDLFGQPCNYDAIRDVIGIKDIHIIEDAAQAIGATYKDKYTGTLGDIGVFSFTQGKILHSGEGGMIVTNSEYLAMQCRLRMNHAEAVVQDMETLNRMRYAVEDFTLGYNLRMTEVQAAILRCQLNKLDDILKMRRINAAALYFMLKDIPAIRAASIRNQCTHSYYTQPFHWVDNKINRDKYLRAVSAELMPEDGRLDKALIGYGYTEPLYKLPLFKSLYETRSIKQKKLPVVEDLQKKSFFYTMFHGLPLTKEDIQDISDAFHKVWENRNEL